jgi:hypothetical protein
MIFFIIKNKPTNYFLIKENLGESIFSGMMLKAQKRHVY